MYTYVIAFSKLEAFSSIISIVSDQTNERVDPRAFIGAFQTRRSDAEQRILNFEPMVRSQNKAAILFESRNL